MLVLLDGASGVDPRLFCLFDLLAFLTTSLRVVLRYLDEDFFFASKMYDTCICFFCRYPLPLFATLQETYLIMMKATESIGELD